MRYKVLVSCCENLLETLYIKDVISRNPGMITQRKSKIFVRSKGRREILVVPWDSETLRTLASNKRLEVVSYTKEDTFI